MEFSTITYGFIGISFLLAGFVKGIVGLGLPTVSLALLTVVIDLPTAMALLIIPSFFTNIWQALAGKHIVWLLGKLWSLLLAVAFFVWVGVALSELFETGFLTQVFGTLLFLYAALSLCAKPLTMTRSLQPYFAPVCGAVNGILTGLTGSLFIPGVMYLNAIGLSRDQLVQAMGLLFSLSTLALGVCLHGVGRVNLGLWQISLLALFPTLLGMQSGYLFRRYLSEVLFRKIFLCGLMLLGIYIVFQ